MAEKGKLCVDISSNKHFRYHVQKQEEDLVFSSSFLDIYIYIYRYCFLFCQHTLEKGGRDLFRCGPKTQREVEHVN